MTAEKTAAFRAGCRDGAALYGRPTAPMTRAEAEAVLCDLR